MKKNKGIWEYENLYTPKIPREYQISLNEGNTELIRLKNIEIDTGIENVFAKREDKNPTGSAKDRSIAYYFSYLKYKGIKEIIIPSSGNTAISAANYSKLSGIKVYLYLSSKLEDKKDERLELAIKNNKKNISVIKTLKPLSDAIKFSKENNIEIFRGSNTKYAEQGYKSIGEELYNLRADALFIPVSSGTTLYGISKKINKNCKIHLVQTSKINTISHLFDNNFKSEDETLAKAIVARVTNRKKDVEKIINKTRGWGWTIENKEIDQYQKLLRKNGVYTSYEGALALAGLYKALENGYLFKKVVILFTGV